MNTHKKSIKAGINLRGTAYSGMSASELRKANPALAQKWAGFIHKNSRQLVKEIADKICS